MIDLLQLFSFPPQLYPYQDESSSKASSSSFLDFNVAQTNVSRAAAVIQKIIAERSRIEWIFFLVNLIFSSTFLTIFCIALIINKDLQRIVFIALTWAIWLIGSTVFLFLRLSIAFVSMKAVSKAICAVQCAKYSFQKDPRERLLAELEGSESFDEWLEIALQLDQLTGSSNWRLNPESELYEWRGLAKQVSRLRIARLNNDMTQLMFLLRLSSSRNFCGLSNPLLYSEALSGTKCLVEEFTEEVCLALKLICYDKDEDGMNKKVEKNDHEIQGNKNEVEDLKRKLSSNLTSACQRSESIKEDSVGLKEEGKRLAIDEKNSRNKVKKSRQQLRETKDVDSSPERVEGQSVVYRRRLGNRSPLVCRTIAVDDLSDHGQTDDGVKHPYMESCSTIRTVQHSDESVEVQDRGIQTDNLTMMTREMVNSWMLQNEPPLLADGSGFDPTVIGRPRPKVITTTLNGFAGPQLLPKVWFQPQTTPHHFNKQLFEERMCWSPNDESPLLQTTRIPANIAAQFCPLIGKSLKRTAAGSSRYQALPSTATAGHTSDPLFEGCIQPPVSMLEWQAENDYQLHDMFTPSSSTSQANDQFAYLQRFTSIPQEMMMTKQMETKDYDAESDLGGRSPLRPKFWSNSRSGADLKKMEETLKFLVTLRLSLGRTALCLSGGGSLAMYHMGIVRVLLEQKCLPRVVSGTSGGSIVAGVVAIYNDQELMDDILFPDIVRRYGVRWFPPVSRQLQRFFLKGQMMDGVEFEQTCKAYYGEYTFKDAFLKTGRLVSIVVTPASRASGEALILNHINTPDVFIWSAVTASCSLPGLLPPHELMVRSIDGTPVPYCPSGLKWMDGSLTQDIPIKELASLFNVKQFIVSQVNPHHAPFVKDHTSGLPWMQSIENWLTLDIKNRYAKLAKFNLVPRIFGQNVSSFWMLQVFEGHVTITPRASLIDWYRMVNQPSIEDMEDFFLKGQQRAWPHLPRIIQMLKIEQTLRQCWTDLTHRIRTHSIYPNTSHLYDHYPLSSVSTVPTISSPLQYLSPMINQQLQPTSTISTVIPFSGALSPISSHPSINDHQQSNHHHQLSLLSRSSRRRTRSASAVHERFCSLEDDSDCDATR